MPKKPQVNPAAVQQVYNAFCALITEHSTPRLLSQFQAHYATLKTDLDRANYLFIFAECVYKLVDSHPEIVASLLQKLRPN